MGILLYFWSRFTEFPLFHGLSLVPEFLRTGHKTPIRLWSHLGADHIMESPWLFGPYQNWLNVGKTPNPSSDLPSRLLNSHNGTCIHRSLVVYANKWLILKIETYVVDKSKDNGIASIDPSHKSINISYKYPTMHHLVTEMCTCMPISVTKWHMELANCGICATALLEQILLYHRKKTGIK